MFSDDVSEKGSQLILSSLLSVRSKIRRQSLSIFSCSVVQKRPFYYRFYHPALSSPMLLFFFVSSSKRT